MNQRIWSNHETKYILENLVIYVFYLFYIFVLIFKLKNNKYRWIYTGRKSELLHYHWFIAVCHMYSKPITFVQYTSSLEDIDKYIRCDNNVALSIRKNVGRGKRKKRLSDKSLSASAWWADNQWQEALIVRKVTCAYI